MTIKGIIFDLDGVITDTAEYHFLAWKRLADEENLDFTREDNEQLRGVSRRESLKRLLKGKVISEDKMQSWMHRKNEYYKAYLDDITPDDLLPGVSNFLEEAQAQGLKLAIGSASKNAKPVIEKLNLINVFEVIGDGYSVVNAKPAPDLFVWVAGGLHLHVADVIVFEDSPAGIDAAKSAGCKTVGIGKSKLSHADFAVRSFEEITLNDVINKLMNTTL
ncbi:MAG: beta-phosphoglucomutase [Chloroflexota bacterium]